ncbi:MAG: hypothetical protein DHS20C18_51580 [Saprospiraceae bacterium]|nr:MAG: hypothetical protein DHS20C18_51580 [Saprospiraceae bacterium]
MQVSKLDRENIWNEDVDNITTFHAISVSRSAIYDDLILDNYIDNAQFAGAALIYVKDDVAGTGTVLIDRDTIISIDDAIGIELRVNMGENMYATNNHIDMQNAGMGAIVFNSLGDNIVFADNFVQATGAQQTLFLNHAQNTIICNNQILDGNVGIWVDQNSSGASIGLNAVSNQQQRGLLLLGNGINLGDQIHLGNTWNGTFPSFAAQHTGVDFQNSRFLVNSDPNTCGNATYFPTSNGIPSVQPASGWFIDIPGQCINDCHDLIPKLSMKSVFQTTMENGFGIWSPAILADAERYLYLSHNLALASEIPVEVLADFETSFISGEGGSFYQLETLIRQIYQLNESVKENLRVAKETQKQLADSYNDSFLSLQADPTNEALHQHLQLQLNDLNEGQSELNILMALANESVEQKIAAAQLYLEEISATSIHGTYLKFVFDALLKKYAGISLDATQLTQLEQIAGTCYEEAGMAKNLAIGLLPIERQQSFYDTEPCNESFSLPENNQYPANTDTAFSIQPNPANNEVFMLFSNAQKDFDELIVTDQWGRRYQVNLNGNRLDTHTLNPGLFYVYLLKKGGIIAATKFIKQ